MAFRSKNLTLLQPRVGSADDDTGDAGLSTALYCYRTLDAAGGGDDLATIIADGFITNAADYGIAVGDTILFISLSTAGAGGGTFAVVNDFTAGAANVTALSGMT